jgi:CelD/BcsL family acetyltransferase involved in cellulose biosynthesis
MLRATIVDDIDQLARWEGPWRDLLARSSTNEPVLSPSWLLPWWRVFGGCNGRMLRAVLLRDGERLIALAPLLRRRHVYQRAIPFRRIESLASGEGEHEETCSDYLNIIVERGFEAAAAETLAGALSDGSVDRFDELVLPSMSRQGPFPELLGAALERRGFVIDLQHSGDCPHIPLPSTWDAYLSKLPSNCRYLVRRSVRDFEAWAKSDAKLHVARTPEQLAIGRQILLDLHADRWRANGRAGVFASDRFARFHREVQTRLLDEGALALSWIAVRGDPIAVLYNIVWDRKIYFYQSGRKVDVPKGIRPGIVAHAYAIQQAIADGCREYDFLAGDSHYKRQLALASRSLATLRAVRPGLRERVRIVAERARELVQRLRA